MSVLVFEWLTGGGAWTTDTFPSSSDPFLKQGRSMLMRLVADLIANGSQVHSPIDARICVSNEFCSDLFKVHPINSRNDLQSTIRELAQSCDHILLIAPECGSCLAECHHWVEAFSKKLVSPDFKFVKLASDKQATIELLDSKQVPVPAGVRLSAFDYERHADQIGLPAVVKPIDGAGSDGVELIQSWADLNTKENLAAWRVERFVPGIPVSVSILCGKSGFQLLPPTGQRFDRKPIGHYIGTDYPLPAQIANVATKLAEQAMAALPATKGYIGVDMIIDTQNQKLSERESKGWVIEVNPRLTTSYIRLSAELGPELAQRMLDLALQSGESSSAEKTHRS